MDSRENQFDPALGSDPALANRNYPNPTQTSYYTTETSYDESGYPREAKQTGHWGIQTCNWAGEGIPYRIVVGGVYKYDQSVTGTLSKTPFAMADAECSTGYPASSSLVKDHLGQTATFRDELTGSFVEDILSKPSDVSDSVTKVTDRARRSLAPWVVTTTSTATSTRTWIDQFLPAHYGYFFDGLNRGTFLNPGDTFAANDLLPATRDYLDFYVRETTNPRGFAHKDNLDLYGTDWKDNRLRYTVTHAASANTIEPGQRKVDGLDLSIGWGANTRNFVQWEPLTPMQSAPECSSDHIYYYDVNWNDPLNPLIANTPLHFNIQDVLPYQEWDNCGLLSISVSIRTNPNSIPIPPQPAFGPEACHYVPAPISTLVTIRDLKVEPADPFRAQSAHAYYFDPTNTVVNEWRFTPGAKVPDVYQASCSASKGLSSAACFADAESNYTNTVVVWQNSGFGPHSITASLDKKGRFCTNVVTVPHPLVNTANPSGNQPTTVQSGPITVQANLPLGSPNVNINRLIGNDDCDHRINGEGKPVTEDNVERLFDSNPFCLSSVDKASSALQSRTAFCMSPQQNFAWTVDLNGIKGNPDVCSNGYCTIPYFCRVAPDTMRGNLVVRIGAGRTPDYPI